MALHPHRSVLVHHSALSKCQPDISISTIRENTWCFWSDVHQTRSAGCDYGWGRSVLLRLRKKSESFFLGVSQDLPLFVVWETSNYYLYWKTEDITSDLEVCISKTISVVFVWRSFSGKNRDHSRQISRNLLKCTDSRPKSNLESTSVVWFWLQISGYLLTWDTVDFHWFKFRVITIYLYSCAQKFCSKIGGQ